MGAKHLSWKGLKKATLGYDTYEMMCIQSFVWPLFSSIYKVGSGTSRSWDKSEFHSCQKEIRRLVINHCVHLLVCSRLMFSTGNPTTMTHIGKDEFHTYFPNHLRMTRGKKMLLMLKTPGTHRVLQQHNKTHYRSVWLQVNQMHVRINIWIFHQLLFKLRNSVQALANVHEWIMKFMSW